MVRMSPTFEQIDIESLTEQQQKLLLEKLVAALSGGNGDVASLFGMEACPDLPSGTEEILVKEYAEYQRAGIKGKPWQEVLNKLGKKSK